MPVCRQRSSRSHSPLPARMRLASHSKRSWDGLAPTERRSQSSSRSTDGARDGVGLVLDGLARHSRHPGSADRWQSSWRFKLVGGRTRKCGGEALHCCIALHCMAVLLGIGWQGLRGTMLGMGWQICAWGCREICAWGFALHFRQLLDLHGQSVHRTAQRHPHGLHIAGLTDAVGSQKEFSHNLFMCFRCFQLLCFRCFQF